MDTKDFIKSRRSELGMSQRDLAKAVGYKSRSAIAKIESGENDIPRAKLEDFARALDVDVSSFFSDAPFSKGIQDQHLLDKASGIAPIQTTGGLYTEEIRQTILANICQVFDCEPDDIYELVPVQAGLTNIVLSFKHQGGKFIYRHPGLGSDALVNRGREAIMQAIVGDAGIDRTLVAMDVENGWRIGRYVESRKFDYHNLNDMVRGIMLLRQLHEVPCRVRWNYDVIERALSIKAQIPEDQYGNFPDFEELTARVLKLDELTRNDSIKRCNVHGDARDENFLLNKDEIHLIDWEYAGYGDPGFDLGSYICGGDHTQEDVDRILFTYFRHEPTLEQKRHFYAYIAITGWFYLHWAMLKESKGQRAGKQVETLISLWCRYGKYFSALALELYGEEV